MKPKKGLKVNSWTLIKPINSNRPSGLWLCKCKCGIKKPVGWWSLSKSKSKGCYNCSRLALTTHGDAGSSTKGIKPRRIYKLWASVKSRTTRKTASDFERYGKRGIKMYSKWLNNYEAFKEYVTSLPNCPKDIFDRPKGRKGLEFTLDRIDNNKGYLPGNLRWADYSTQNRNRRGTNILVKGNKKIVFLNYCEKHNLTQAEGLKRAIHNNWELRKT